MKVTRHINRKVIKKLKIKLAHHINCKINVAHKRRKGQDKDLVLRPSDTGRVSKELTAAIIDFIKNNITRPYFWYINLHYENESDWELNLKLDKLTDERLNKLYKVLKLGDLSDNRKYKIWTIAQWMIGLNEQANHIKDELSIFNKFLENK